jgi:tRNA(Arg) A34 adenosine deaminase TadA
MTVDNFMSLAIAKAREGIAAGQSPFGAVIVRDGQVLAAAHNTVWLTNDPTAHAEVNAIRLASTTLKSIRLPGCILLSTCEPCPMCLAASHWAKLERIIYGASIADAAAAGFSELHLPAAELVKLGGSHLHVESDCCRQECVALFAEWKQAKGRPY